MKSLLCLLAATLGVGIAGCAQIEVEEIGGPFRTVSGTAELEASAALPAGSVMLVQVIDRGDAMMGPTVIGQSQEEIEGRSPFAFSVELRVSDEAVLRRGVRLEVQILVDGRLRYRNLADTVISSQNVDRRAAVRLQAVGP